jgi:O-Antigen ligase
MAIEPASLPTGRTAGDPRLGVELASDGALAAAAAVGVAATAAAQGGFFPTSWGWAALAFAFVAGLAVLLPEGVELSRVELAFLALVAAYVGWTALSIVWSVGVSGTVEELERAMVYALGALALLLVARPGRTVPLLTGVLCGLTGICLYSLAGRLFPASLQSDPDAGYRLFSPVGYWNGLGLLAAMAALLALGFVVEAKQVAARAGAAAALPLLAVTAYFTFSRGAWVALAFGLAVTLAMYPHRLRFLTVAALVAPAPVVAVVLAWRSPALSRITTLADTKHQGHRLALWIVLLCVLAAASAIAIHVFEPRVRIGHNARQAYAAILVALAVGALVVGLVVGGGPVDVARNAYDRFVSGASTQDENLNQRLFRIASPQRAEMWHVAVREFKRQPVVGTGAGTFESYWYEHRRAGTVDTRDAHSLYLETLGELGLIGLVLLVGMLAVPFAGARARGRPLVAVALGVYATLLAHAGYDWDWELPAVMLAGTWCGLAALVESREGSSTALLRIRARTAVLGAVFVAGAFSFVGLVGNMAVASSTDALQANDTARAVREARKAAGWAPWAAKPWALLAQAELGAGQRAAAVADVRRAIEREPRGFRLWDQLAAAATGAERQAALRRAHELDPQGSRP